MCGRYNIGQPIVANECALPGCDTDGTILLSSVVNASRDRIATGIADELFGSDGGGPKGIVRTSVTLLGGEPGAGKSTLLTQLVHRLVAIMGREALYIAAEEDASEIRMRADRLRCERQDLVRVLPAMSGCSDLATVLTSRQPCAIILDSLHGLVGDDAAAADEVLTTLKMQAVRLRAPVIVVQQITKSDEIAGRMSEQHAVDTVMTFTAEGDEKRILHVEKNRFGRAFISATFEMSAIGLREVESSSEDDADEDPH